MFAVVIASISTLLQYTEQCFAMPCNAITQNYLVDGGNSYPYNYVNARLDGYIYRMPVCWLLCSGMDWWRNNWNKKRIKNRSDWAKLCRIKHTTKAKINAVPIQIVWYGECFLSAQINYWIYIHFVLYGSNVVNVFFDQTEKSIILFRKCGNKSNHSHCVCAAQQRV